jgi:glutamyl-tRNA synthetase
LSATREPEVRQSRCGDGSHGWRKDFADSYRHESDQKAWFEQIRELATKNSFAATAGEYKKAASNYLGSISDVSNVIRVAITGRRLKVPKLFRIAQVSGRDEFVRRSVSGDARPNKSKQ